MDRHPFTLILLSTDELAQTGLCGPSRGNQCHVTRGQILPAPGHNAPHQTQSVSRQIERDSENGEGMRPSPNYPLSGLQLAPNLFTQLPTTTAVRDRVPPEPSAGEYWSEVLQANLKEHKAKATRKAQEVRNKNAEATKRYRETRRAEARAAAIKKEIAMKQELDDAKIQLQREREGRLQSEAEKRLADAEIERLRR
ncbi:hypothetical protein E4U52_001067, partial [Claviceps spartinae]